MFHTNNEKRKWRKEENNQIKEKSESEKRKPTITWKLEEDIIKQAEMKEKNLKSISGERENYSKLNF